MAHAVDPLSELDRQLQRGSMFTQAALQRTTQRLSETEAILARVIDHLAAGGLVDPEALGLVGEEPAPADEQDRPSTTITWPAVAIRDEDPDDQDPPEVVDCAARMPVCQAVCCRLKFPLSAAEIGAGRVRWDIGHPYLIRHESDGWCSHLERGSKGCTVYEDRPAVCRTYSCAGDRRIWEDFDRMILNRAWIEEHLTPGDGIYVEAVVASMEVPVQLTRKPVGEKAP